MCEEPVQLPTDPGSGASDEAWRSRADELEFGRTSSRVLKWDWLLDSVSQRTILWYDTTTNGLIKQRNKKTYRNPIILAREMSLMMEMEELSRADLARKLGLSRARVTQMLNLLKLPEELFREIEELGDYWDRQLVTERQLRNSICFFRNQELYELTTLNEINPDFKSQISLR